jgi:hypothetical protein
MGDGQPYRQRCKRGHPWTVPQTELLEAYRIAVRVGRGEIVLGVDC